MSHVKVFILALLASICKICFPLQCYQCLTTDESTCLNDPNIVTCTPYKQAACMSLSYKTNKDGKVVERYMKGCWDSHESCLVHCDTAEAKREMKNCKGLCCTTDKCNVGSLEVVYQDKRKRAADQENGSGKNVQPFYYCIFFLIVINYIFLT